MANKQHHKRVFPGLLRRQAHYLIDVPVKLLPGMHKPGSQNRKRSGKSKRIEIDSE